MKTMIGLVCLFLVGGWTMAEAAVVVAGADGSDGELVVATSTVIDLGKAATATWDTPSPTAGLGVYDPQKWAVVFKYSSVNIATGATLTFINHPSRAPVVWLVNGNVTINGTLDINGKTYVGAPNLAEPGPGGFRGGTHFYTSGIGASAGFGVGGGGTEVTNRGFGGSHATAGGSGPAAYGNPSLIPLLGGSGGGGARFTGGGGGGGGAMLIVAANTLTVNGSIQANGGSGRGSGFSDQQSGGGAGGGIRLVCDTLAGTGSLSAIGGGGQFAGGLGRIRVERVVNANTIVATPDPSVLGLEAGATALIWPPAGAPEVKIVSIGGESVPDDPLASFGTHGADTVLAETSTTTVVVETTNVEAASQVKVRVTPRANANYSEVDATVTETLSEEPLVLRWTATGVPVRAGYSAVQVKVVRP